MPEEGVGLLLDGPAPSWTPEQGDQIGQNFALWDIVYFGHFCLKKMLIAPVFELLFSHNNLCT
jgi:hypothetical protein